MKKVFFSSLICFFVLSILAPDLSAQNRGQSIPRHSFSLVSGPVIPGIWWHAGISYSYYPLKYLEIQAHLKVLGFGVGTRVHFLGTDRYRLSPYAGVSFSGAGLLSGSSIVYFPVGTRLALGKRLAVKADFGFSRYYWEDFLRDSGNGITFTGNIEFEYCFRLKP